MQKKRDLSLDIAKGICIIFMVIGHAGCPEWMNRFMSLFRMPCFFFISGILLSDRYLSNIKSGILKKIKGYYRPFVKWTLIFLLLHNLFACLHIYDSTYTLQEIAIKAVRVVAMSAGEQLLGGYWFLISLTWASIGSILFLGILKKLNKLTNINIIGGGILAILVASSEHLMPIKLPQQFGPQTFLALAFFLSGYLYRRLNLKKTAYLSLLLIVPALASCFLNLSMQTSDKLSGLYFVIALCGAIAFLQISKLFVHGSIVKIFNYIGNKTLYILTFHFLAFKPVTYVLLKIGNRPMELMSAFPTLETEYEWMWMVYSISGIALSLLMWELLHLPFLKYKKNKTEK